MCCFVRVCVEKFVPGTGDKVVAALKSEENEDAKTQNTFLMVFTLDGEVLLEETEVRVFFFFCDAICPVISLLYIFF